MGRPRRRAVALGCALGLLLPWVPATADTRAPSIVDPNELPGDAPERWNGRPGLLPDLDGRSSVPVPIPRLVPLEPGSLPMAQAGSETRAVPIPEAEVGAPQLRPGPRSGPGGGELSGPLLDPRQAPPTVVGPRDGLALRDPRLP